MTCIYCLSSIEFKIDRTVGGVVGGVPKAVVALLQFALPICSPVCLEWWWNEMMTLCLGFPWRLGSSVPTRVENELGARRPELARNATISLWDPRSGDHHERDVGNYFTQPMGPRIHPIPRSVVVDCRSSTNHRTLRAGELSPDYRICAAMQDQVLALELISDLFLGGDARGLVLGV